MFFSFVHHFVPPLYRPALAKFEYESTHLFAAVRCCTAVARGRWMSWPVGGCVVSYVGECFRACVRWSCYFVFGTAASCFSPVYRPALAYFESTTSRLINCRIGYKSGGDRCNLVLEAQKSTSH